MLSAVDKQLLNAYQQDFPLVERPFQVIAEALGLSEAVVLEAYQRLCTQRYVSRIGPVITPNRMGASALVAMAIEAADLEAVAALISAYPNVNHNYERENHYNLWFVLMAATPAELQQVIDDIEQRTGYTAMVLPMLKDFYINLGFELDLDDAQSG